jgi:hypothetical protein
MFSCEPGACRDRERKNDAKAKTGERQSGGPFSPLSKGFDVAEISGAAANITVHGARYPEHLEKLTGR